VELIAFAERDAALQVEHDDVANRPFLDLHGCAPESFRVSLTPACARPQTHPGDREAPERHLRVGGSPQRPA
jgi:hypothetical protein